MYNHLFRIFCKKTIRNREAKQLFEEAQRLHFSSKHVEALPLLERASQLGYPPAFGLLLFVYYVGGYGYVGPKDLKKEAFYRRKCELNIAWFENHAAQGDVTAQHFLGVFYSNGYGVSKNDFKAIFWMEKAARQGHPVAQYNLGFMYNNGFGVAVNASFAFESYEKSAVNGYVDALVAVGDCYRDGIGVVQNKKIAFDKYLEAATKGSALGQYAVGKAYSTAGSGVPENLIEAIKWLQRGAEQGAVDAQVSLAAIYLDENVVKDVSQAMHWCRKAAEQGSYLAEEFLGEHYKNDCSVPNNKLIALRWYINSFNHGNEKIKDKIGKLLEQVELGSLQPQRQYLMANKDVIREYLKKNPRIINPSSYRDPVVNPYEASPTGLNSLRQDDGTDGEECLSSPPTANNPHLVYLVKGTDAGKKAWYYVLVHSECVSEFCKRMHNSDIVHLEHFGTILYSDYGAEPPDDITGKVKREYNIDGDSTPILEHTDLTSGTGKHSPLADNCDLGLPPPQGSKVLPVSSNTNCSISPLTASQGAGKEPDRRMLFSHRAIQAPKDAHCLYKEADLRITSRQRRKAEAGDATMQKLMGKNYELGQGGIDKNTEKAVEWYKKSAQQGHVGGLYCLAKCHEEGIGVQINFQEAIRIYELAKQRGNSRAGARILVCAQKLQEQNSLRERQAREQRERQVREQRERQAREQRERQAREQRERQAREQRERQAREQRERQAREQREHQAREQREYQARAVHTPASGAAWWGTNVTTEQTNHAREDAERRAREEKNRRDNERQEQERRHREQRELEERVERAKEELRREEREREEQAAREEREAEIDERWEREQKRKERDNLRDWGRGRDDSDRADYLDRDLNGDNCTIS